MKFCWTTIYIKNMEKSLHFYQAILGLEVAERFKTNDNTEIAMLGEKETSKVELICNKEITHSSTGISLGFEVDSLEEAMQLMKENGIPIKRGPISPVPSTRFFFVDDPDGVEIQIVQHSH